jgi:hypothetical protein
MPCCVSSIKGCPPLDEAANATGEASASSETAAHSEGATAPCKARINWTGAMSGPGWLWECRIAQKTLYLTAVATFKLVDIEWSLDDGQ